MIGADFDHLSFFHGLEPDQRDLVRTLFTMCYEEAGTVIFNQGDLAEFLYVVAEGEVNVRFKPYDGPELIVGRIKAGSVVGWSAALGRPKYTSSAICTTDCKLLRLDSSDLRELCENNPKIGALVLDRLAILIAERLRNTHQHVRSLLEQGLGLCEMNHALLEEFRK